MTRLLCNVCELYLDPSLTGLFFTVSCFTVNFMCQKYTIYDWHWDAPTLAKSAIGKLAAAAPPLRYVTLRYLNRIVSYRIVLYRIVSCRIVSCRIVSYRVVQRNCNTIIPQVRSRRTGGPGVIGHVQTRQSLHWLWSLWALFTYTGIIAAITYIVQGVLCIGNAMRVQVNTTRDRLPFTGAIRAKASR